MAHLDIVSLAILISIGLIISFGLVLLATKRYEIAVVLVAFSAFTPLLNPTNGYLPSEEFETGIVSYLRALLLALMACVSIVKFLQLRMQERHRESPDFVLLAIFILLALVSAGYSIDQGATLMRSLNFVAFFCFLLGFYHWLEEGRFAEVFRVLFWLVFIGGVANLLSLALPDLAWWYAAPNRFKGLWAEPNRMGSFCMVAYPICLWKYVSSSARGRWIALGAIATLAVMHLLSGSRSSMIGAGVGVSTWLFISQGKAKGLAFLGGVILLFGVMLLVSPKQLDREENLGPAELTGRSELWDAAIFLLKEKPVLGYGYEVGGKIFDDHRFYDPRRYLLSGSALVSLHDGYLSVAVGLGLVGLLLWLAVLLPPIWKAVWSPFSEQKAVVIPILVSCLILNFSESLISGGREFADVVFWMSWVMAERLGSVEAAVLEVQQASSGVRWGNSQTNSRAVLSKEMRAPS